MRSKFKCDNIIFSPEFLRESRALHDNLYPARIVVGDNTNEAKNFGKILADCAVKNSEEIPILFMKSSEAEAVKLFSNTYLAMRISFFNELDSFAEVNDLSSKKLITGISHDPRIGDYYNNPSFGYGGYCLPKDTKQLLDSFDNIPNKIIKAVVDSIETQRSLLKSILKQNPKKVGVYRLIMKMSQIISEKVQIYIINSLLENNLEVIVYEPFYKSIALVDVNIENNFENSQVKAI